MSSKVETHRQETGIKASTQTGCDPLPHLLPIMNCGQQL